MDNVTADPILKMVVALLLGDPLVSITLEPLHCNKYTDEPSPWIIKSPYLYTCLEFWVKGVDLLKTNRLFTLQRTLHFE